MHRGRLRKKKVSTRDVFHGPPSKCYPKKMMLNFRDRTLRVICDTIQPLLIFIGKMTEKLKEVFGLKLAGRIN